MFPKPPIISEKLIGDARYGQTHGRRCCPGYTVVADGRHRERSAGLRQRDGLGQRVPAFLAAHHWPSSSRVWSPQSGNTTSAPLAFSSWAIHKTESGRCEAQATAPPGGVVPNSDEYFLWALPRPGAMEQWCRPFCPCIGGLFLSFIAGPASPIPNPGKCPVPRGETRLIVVLPGEAHCEGKVAIAPSLDPGDGILRRSQRVSNMTFVEANETNSCFAGPRPQHTRTHKQSSKWKNSEERKRGAPKWRSAKLKNKLPECEGWGSFELFFILTPLSH